MSIHNTDENLCKSMGWDHCLSYHFGVSGLRISVMTFGRRFTFDVDNSLEITTQESEERFYNMDVVPAEVKMQMFVRTTTKQLVKVEVKCIMADVDADTVKTGVHEMEGTFPELFVKTTPKKNLKVEVASQIIEFRVVDNVNAGIQSLDRTSPASLSNAHLQWMFLDVKLKVSVKTVTGKIITLKVESSDTNDEVNTCIQPVLPPPPPLNCDVVMLTLPPSLQRQRGRRHFKLEVKSCDTIDNVKSTLEDEFGYPAEEQQLDLSGQVLEDGRVVALYLWDPVTTRCGSSLLMWARGKETERGAERSQAMEPV